MPCFPEATGEATRVFIQSAVWRPPLVGRGLRGGGASSGAVGLQGRAFALEDCSKMRAIVSAFARCCFFHLCVCVCVSLRVRVRVRARRRTHVSE